MEASGAIQTPSVPSQLGRDRFLGAGRFVLLQVGLTALGIGQVGRHAVEVGQELRNRGCVRCRRRGSDAGGLQFRVTEHAVDVRLGDRRCAVDLRCRFQSRDAARLVGAVGLGDLAQDLRIGAAGFRIASDRDDRQREQTHQSREPNLQLPH
jgi:hypothetical protein